ncbi:hypothetical protein RHIZ404_220876 [Rhizobium sp. EC-SD404]|nr:hypothetical protein RHIZ404_220876 [Rhizobium sp. EC-SD404]
MSPPFSSACEDNQAVSGASPPGLSSNVERLSKSLGEWTLTGSEIGQGGHRLSNTSDLAESANLPTSRD